jgi:predicted secreted protein
MSGELNGTAVIVSDSANEIVGQGECTLTFNGTPIDISNKSSGDYIALLDGELAGKQLQVSMTIVYNDDSNYEAMRADALAGAQSVYSITYGATGEIFSATFVPTGLSDALPHGDKVSTSLTLMSSGVVTHTPATVI